MSKFEADNPEDGSDYESGIEEYAKTDPDRQNQIEWVAAPAEAPDAGSGAADVLAKADHLASLRPGVIDSVEGIVIDAAQVIRELRNDLAAAEEALRACINADVVGYWSAEEVAKRYFAGREASDGRGEGA